MRKIFDYQNKSNSIIYIMLFFIAFLVIFSSTYNPINFRRMHVDSSVYVTIAQGITRGQLPYKDFVDNKGPLLYLLNAAGLRIGGFTGIWITELILMCISVFFAYKTALFFGDRYKAFLGTVFSFVALLAFFSLFAGTEEYTLPFLIISLFIFTKYFFSPKREICFSELIILGMCFAFAIMMRLNNFPLWVGFCLVIFVESIIKRRFVLLGKYVAGFCIGIIIVFVPLFLYLRLNGIFDLFVKQVIMGGTARGFGGATVKETVKNFFWVLNRTYSALPLCLGLFWTITNFKQKHFAYYLGYTISYFLSVLFLSVLSGGDHFNIGLIPLFIPVITFFVDIVHKEFSQKKLHNAVLIIFFFLVFIEGATRYSYNLLKIFFDNSGEHLIRAGRMIDENTKPGDKIISLGFNGYIYPFTQRDATSKYIYQGSGLDQIPDSREEFISDILTGKPAIIALFNEEDGIGQIMDSWHQPVFDMIETDYRILSDDNGFILYIRRIP